MRSICSNGKKVIILIIKGNEGKIYFIRNVVCNGYLRHILIYVIIYILINTMCSKTMLFFKFRIYRFLGQAKLIKGRPNLFLVNNKELLHVTCQKLTKRHQSDVSRCYSGVFIDNFENIKHTNQFQAQCSISVPLENVRKLNVF